MGKDTTEVIEVYELNEHGKLFYKEPMDFIDAEGSNPIPDVGDYISLLGAGSSGIFKVVRWKFCYYRFDELNDPLKWTLLQIYVCAEGTSDMFKMH